MAFFPLDCVLRGFPAAAYVQYASPQTLVRLVEHINEKNQGVKSRSLAGSNEKKFSFMNWTDNGGIHYSWMGTSL